MMRLLRCLLRVLRIQFVVPSLIGLVAVTTSAGAQETVHQALEKHLGPGQTKGAATAPVIVEEFSDFQCSYCGKFSRETLPRLTKAYVDTGMVRLIYRHYAILGPDSEAAAEAAACAGAQDHFWPYHDRLFATQGRLAFSRKNLLGLAQELSLNLTDFATCLDSGRFRSQVQDETNTAMVLGLRGTPGFIINGRAMAGALPFDVFQSVIEEALATATSSPPSPPEAGATSPQPSSK